MRHGPDTRPRSAARHVSRYALAMAAGLALIGPARSAAAQAVAVPEAATPEAAAAAAPDAKKKKKPEGWTTKLSLSGTGSAHHSSGVVGTAEGSVVQVGLVVEGSAERVSGAHEWLTAIKAAQTQSREPVLDQFVKSADLLDLHTTWLYRLAGLDWVGPYARARATTALFAGYVVRADDVSVQRIDANGNAAAPVPVPAGDRIDLTSGLEPLVVSESVGAFANPIERKALTMKSKLGAGLQNVIAGGGHALVDDAKTPQLELVALRSTHQAGAEFEVELGGDIDANTAWRASSLFFLPVYSTGNGAIGLDAMSTQIGAGLKVKLSKWASFDYTFSARKLPAVVDRWQVQNGVMVTASFDVL